MRSPPVPATLGQVGLMALTAANGLGFAYVRAKRPRPQPIPVLAGHRPSSATAFIILATARVSAAMRVLIDVLREVERQHDGPPAFAPSHR